MVRTYKLIKLVDSLTSEFENYVNKLSIWIAYYIFLLSVFFSKIMAMPQEMDKK